MAVGGVVGYNMGTIHDVVLTGENDIAGVNCTGGISGGNMGTVYNCSVDGTTIRVLGDNDFSSGRIIQVDMAECGGLVIGGSFGGIIDNCTAEGVVIAEGNEPVGMGGIAGCLEMMDSITNCTAEVEIISERGGHAIGGLCGYSGTHSNGMVVAETEGMTKCLRFFLSAISLSLSADHRIDKSLELPAFNHREPGFLHAPGNAAAVFSVMITAFHQRKENMVVYPAADAANARI